MHLGRVRYYAIQLLEYNYLFNRKVELTIHCTVVRQQSRNNAEENTTADVHYKYHLVHGSVHLDFDFVHIKSMLVLRPTHEQP
jgi:hypothetical protein